MSIIDNSILQAVDGLTSSQNTQNTDKTSSNEFENLLGDASSEFLTSTLFSNTQINIADLVEASKEVDTASEDNSSKMMQLEEQRTSSIQNSANIMKALLNS